MARDYVLNPKIRLVQPRQNIGQHVSVHQILLRARRAFHGSVPLSDPDDSGIRSLLTFTWRKMGFYQ